MVMVSMPVQPPFSLISCFNYTKMWLYCQQENSEKASYFNDFQLFYLLEIYDVFYRFMRLGLVDAQAFQQPSELLRAEA
jgi:hypothetical protein